MSWSCSARLDSAWKRPARGFGARGGLVSHYTDARCAVWTSGRVVDRELEPGNVPVSALAKGAMRDSCDLVEEDKCPECYVLWMCLLS